MKRLLSVALAILASFFFITSPAAETTSAADELTALVKQVQGKLRDGKKTEADLSDELKQFDSILAKHKDEKSDDVAQVLLMKAMLYLQVLDQEEKGTELVKQLKRDFPDSKQGKSADSILENLKQQAESKKIRDALVEGAVFPGFEEKDLDGKPLSIAALKGKVVLVDFWATWCGPCVRELPNVTKAYESHHKKGFDIVGISLDQDEQKLRSFLKDKNMTWQQFFDGKGWGNKLAAKYGVNSIPATYLLGPDGKIIGKDLRGDDLVQAVTKALANK
jgi:thiol-disulfide isomerase/thioredoxin